MGIATSLLSLIPQGVLQGSSSSNVRKRRFLVLRIPSLQGKAYRCLLPCNFGRSIPLLSQRYNVCWRTQVYREPQCNPHDAIRTMQSSRCNPHDTICTMQSTRYNLHNAHDAIRAMQSHSQSAHLHDGHNSHDGYDGHDGYGNHDGHEGLGSHDGHGLTGSLRPRGP